MKRNKPSFKKTLSILTNKSIVKYAGEKKHVINIRNPNKVSQHTGWDSNLSFGFKTGLPNTYNFGNNNAMMNTFVYNRFVAYGEYEQMDMHPIVSTALNVISSSATNKNEKQEMLTIKTDNEKINDTLENLFYNILNVESNLQEWLRDALKYGNRIILLETMEEIGVIGFHLLPINLVNIYIDEDGNYYYSIANEYGNISSGANFKTTKEEAFLKVERGEWFDESSIIDLKITANNVNFYPYGKSYIEYARKKWKELILLEEAWLINQVEKAPSRRIYKIDIGGIKDSEIGNYMERVKNAYKRTRIFDENGDINYRYNAINSAEDLFVPVRGGNSGTEIEVLEGTPMDGMETVEYFRDMLISFLQVPKPFLTFDESIGGGKATLAAEDLKFNNTVKNVQNYGLDALTKMAVIHLSLQGYAHGDIESFELSLTNPSVIDEEERLDILQSKVDAATSMLDSGLFSQNYVYNEIFNLSREDVEIMRKEIELDRIRTFLLETLESEGNYPEAEDEEESEEQISNDDEIEDGEFEEESETQDESEKEEDPLSGDGDRLGIKGLKSKQSQQSQIKHNYKGGSPLSLD